MVGGGTDTVALGGGTTIICASCFAASGCAILLGLAFVWTGVARAEESVVVDVDDLASNSGEDLYLLLADLWIDAFMRHFTFSRPSRDDVPRRSSNVEAVYIDVNLDAADSLSAKMFDKLVELMTLFPLFSAPPSLESLPLIRPSPSSESHLAHDWC